MARQAMSGYAFGYSPNTDNYLIVNVSKRHIRDRLVQCHLYSSNEGKWIHRSVNDQRIRNLGSNAVMYRRKAFWINWVGRQFSRANDIVTFELDDFRLQKTRIKREGMGHFQCLAISGDFLSLIGDY
ncbi:hypothetical protein PIB30_013942 [Stylosanthes scabra]|uniref:Uncharacterized protein n=1 Tax=Stylosanthes scabra TaxID=79078 RepID=A0ABU6W4X8_9FABA|nr:hypothetical protein [Stylosanthes scabra]